LKHGTLRSRLKRMLLPMVLLFHKLKLIKERPTMTDLLPSPLKLEQLTLTLLISINLKQTLRRRETKKRRREWKSKPQKMPESRKKRESEPSRIDKETRRESKRVLRKPKINKIKTKKRLIHSGRR